MPNGKVLVLGDDTRSFLAVVRSLGRQGIAVHAAPANFRSPALLSRFIGKIHDLPPWMGDGADWLAAVETLLRAERFDLVIPCDETTLLPLQRHRERLAPLARLAIPDDRAIAVLFDKFETRELALRVGVPIATGRLVRSGDTAKAVLAEFGAPVVVKPRYSYSLDSIASRGKVQVIGDQARLEQHLRERDPEETLLEEFFEGQGQGVSLLASRGRVLQAFEHHRVREIAGASFYRVSAPLAQDLVQACEAIVSAVQYTGLAMFEFKRSDKRWILLEVNARPWGSMPLPISLGVDFPYRWYQLLTTGEALPTVTYRTGIYGRNLVPDLRAIMAQARSLEPAARIWFVIRRAAELLRPLRGREVHDLFVRDDPRPALVELAEQISALRQRTARLLPRGSALRQRRARRLVRRALQNRAGKPIVLFVCQGNICRSPFAEALLRSRLGEETATVGSAGMTPQPGRPTPDLGLQAAAACGLELSAHRSVWLTRQMAEVAALLVVFDETNRTALFDRYPGLKVPVISLGEIAGVDNIVDPVDGDLAEFRRVYGQIAAGVAELVPLLGALHAWTEFSIALSDISSIEELALQWTRLGVGDDDSFFTSWSWIGTWLALLPSSIKPQLLQIERKGRCCGAAIAVRRDTRTFGIAKIRHLHLNETGDPRLDAVTIEHNGFVGQRLGGLAGWQALLDWFESGTAEADELSISGVTQDIVGARLRRLLLLDDRKTPAYRVDLASLRAAGGSVGSILSTNSRQQLSRSMRVFASFGPLKLEAAKDVNEALAFFDALKGLHIQSWTRRGQRHGFVYPFVERFHRSLIERCFPQGEVELLRLTAGSRELGYLYNFCRNGVVYAYQSGFDDKDRRLRPGYVAHALAIERSASLGAMIYDFMAGSNRLKESFATDHYAMHWYTFRRPLLRFRALQAVRNVRLRLQTMREASQ